MSFLDKVWECLGYKPKKDNADYTDLEEEDILSTESVAGSYMRPSIEAYPRTPVSLSSSQVHAIMYDQ